MAEKKYQQYVFSDFREDANLPGVASPQAYFRGDCQIPNAKANFGWQLFTKPLFLERKPHTHNGDEYLIFLGGALPDLFSSFDAEIDLCMGEEEEKYLITKPTIVYVPAGMPHTPLNFRVINKPVFFTAMLLSPVFEKTMEGKYYEFKGMGKMKPGQVLDIDAHFK
jgi:hypothetical protein